MVIQYILFNTLLPEAYNRIIYINKIISFSFKAIIYLSHLFFWGIIWSDIVKYVIPSFYYFTPFHIQFSSTLILIIIFTLIESLNHKDVTKEPRYVV